MGTGVVSRAKADRIVLAESELAQEESMMCCCCCCCCCCQMGIKSSPSLRAHNPEACYNNDNRLPCLALFCDVDLGRIGMEKGSRIASKV